MAKKGKPSEDPKVQARQVVRELGRLYPQSHCALEHGDAYQLIVATILSAQCTDARVNQVTPILFARFPNVRSLARAELAELEALIHSTGFFRSKARNLLAMAGQVVERHGGKIPSELEALTALVGVGRKTANVVLGTAFGVSSGVVVDTHVRRLAYRLGLTTSRDPAVIERDLMRLVPRKQWVDLSHRLIEHGRQVCFALRPRCAECALERICPKKGVGPTSPSAGRLTPR
jgi:endonuclease-3